MMCVCYDDLRLEYRTAGKCEGRMTWDGHGVVGILLFDCS